MGRKLDLQHLSEEECERILQVIQKDFELRQKEKTRLSKAEDSLDTEVKKTVILTQKEEFNATCCIRCCRVFGIIFNRRQTCLNCKLHVCKNCSEYRDKEKGYFCNVCIQSLDLKKQSCDWFYTNVQQRFKRFGSAKVVRSLYKPDGTSEIDPVILQALQNSEVSLSSESDQSKSVLSVPSPRAFSTPQPVALTREEHEDRSRYVKDIYEEQRVSAQKREDEEAENFRKKFESTLAELYRTLDNQTPSADNFQGQNYGDFVANYQNQFKDLLSNLSESLQKIHKHTNGRTDKADRASHIRQTLSKVVENAVGDSMDWGSDEAVSDLSSSTDDGRENEDSAYADQLASVLLAKVVDKHRKAAEERERRRQKEREKEEQKERERERKEREKERERERKQKESEQREKERAHKEELEKAKQRQKEIKELEEEFRLEAEIEREKLKEEEEAKKRFNYDDEFDKLIKFSQGASGRPKAKPRQVEEKVDVAPAQEAPIVKVTRPTEESEMGLIDRVLSLDKLHDSHAKLPDFSYTGSLGFNEVDPDLVSLSHSEFEDNCYDEADYVSENSSRHSSRPWQDNWIFGQDGSRTKARSAVQRVKSDLSDSMYVHVPEKDVSPRVGETDAEDLSDLSENEDKAENDHSDNSDAEAPYYAQTSTEIERVLKRVERTSSVTDSFIHTDESDFDVSKTSSQLRAMKSGRKSTDPSLKLRLSESLDTSVQSDDSSVLSIQERKEELKSSQKFQEMLIPSVNDDPKFDLPPESTTALEGEAIKLVCRVSGTEPIDVFWYRADDDELNEITDSEKCDVSTDGSRHTLIMYNPKRADAGQYTCVALSDTGRCCQYFVVKVKENTQEMKAPEFMRGIDDLEVTEGRSVKFRCKVKGYPQPRVTWYKDGQRITKTDKDYKIDKFGNRDYSLGVEYVTLDHDAEYTVKATNLAGECKQCAQLLVIEHAEVIEKETKLKTTTTAMNFSSSNLKNKPGSTNQRKEEQQIANLSQKMEMTRNGVSEVAEDMLSTAGEKIAAGNVRAVTSTAFGVIQSAEDVIHQEKSNQNFLERKSLRDAYVQPDVTDTLTVDVKMKGVEREESKTSIDSGVFSITGDDRNANNFQRTSSQRYDSKRSSDIGHLDSALDIFSDGQTRNQPTNQNKKSELQMNFSSNRTTYSPPKDLTLNLSGSSSSTSPRGVTSPRSLTSPRGLTSDTDEERIVFGLQPVDKRYSRNYVINDNDAQSQRKKWEVNLNSYSPRAEIVNRKPDEEVKHTEDKIYMTAGKVYSLEDKVQDLENKVRADSHHSAEDLEEEIARAVAQVEQNEKEVHRVETVVAQLKQEVPSDVQFPTPKPRKLQSSEPSQGSSLTASQNRAQTLISQSAESSIPESQSEADGQLQLPSVNRLKNMFSQSQTATGDSSAFRRDSNMVHSITARSFNKQRLSELRQKVHSPEPESTADADLGESELTSVSGDGSTKKYRAPQPPIQPVEATRQSELNRSPQESTSLGSGAKPNTATSSSVRTGTTKARAAFWDKRIQNEIASDEQVSDQFPSMVDESRLVRRVQAAKAPE